MTNLYVLPYRPGSKSAKNLATALDVPVLRKTADSKFVPAISKIVINWGSSGGLPDNFISARFLNRPGYVQRSTNKKIFFRTLFENNYGHFIPEFFLTKQDAYNAFTQLPPGSKMLARTVLNGHSGEGIVVLETPADLAAFTQPCDLFVRYIKKETEYRVHFSDFRRWKSSAGFNPFFIQRKGLKVSQLSAGGANVVPNTLIRNLANGYVYVNEGDGLTFSDLPEAVQTLIVEFGSIQKNLFDLDFGALDIIYNKHYNKAYILEVNTAPGLAGTTVAKYAEVFNNFKNNVYNI